MSDAYERKLTQVYDALDAHNWKVCTQLVSGWRIWYGEPVLISHLSMHTFALPRKLPLDQERGCILPAHCGTMHLTLLH